MRALATGLSLFLLNALAAAAAAAAARWVRRPVGLARLMLFFLLPVAFLGPGFLAGKTPVPADHAVLTLPAVPIGRPYNIWLNDVARQFAPWAKAVRSSWKAGELPHRDRWNGCGTVLDGNGSSAAYSPLTLLALLLPLPAAFTFWGAARLFLALTGTWLWLTEQGVSRRAALFGAVSFSLGLAMTAWLYFPHTAALCLWPWVLFAIERLREPAVRGRAFVLLTVLFFLWPLAGHIETVASACAFTGLWLLARWTAGGRKDALPVLGRIGAAALLALGLSAFSLLPQVLAIHASNRFALTEEYLFQSSVSLLPHGPAWRWGVLMPLFPRLLGDGIRSSVIPSAFGSFPEMTQGYFGIVGIAFLLLIARPGSPRPKAEKALLLPLLFGLGAGIGIWPFAEIVSVLPGFHRMMPTRFLVWFALAGAAIAAFELDRLARDLRDKPRAWGWPVAAFSALLLSGAAAYRHFRPAYAAGSGLVSQRNSFLLSGAALLGALGIMLWAARRARRLASAGVPLLALVAGAELFRQGTRLYQFADPKLLYPVTPLIDFLRSRPAPFRIAGEETSLFPNANVMAGLEDVRTHDAVERRDYVRFLDATCGYDPGAYFKQLGNVNCAALDLLNVRYLVSRAGRAAPSAKWTPVYSGPDGTVFENARCLPRVFAPERLRVVRRRAAGLLLEGADRAYGMPYRELFGGIDWEREAVVLRDGSGGFHPSSAPVNGPATISDYAETANTVSFRVRTDPGGPGAVLVASLVQDGGWRARDEIGRAIALGRANGPFLAIAAPAGDNRIRLVYATPGFRLGGAISFASLAAAGVFAAAAFGRRRSLRERRPRDSATGGPDAGAP